MTICNKCGECCKAICLDETKTAYCNDKSLNEEGAKSISFISKHWRRISRKEAGKIIPEAEYGGGFYYRCDMLSNDNLCGYYDERPPVCQGFPMYHMKRDEKFDSQYPNCSFNGKRGG